MTTMEDIAKGLQGIGERLDGQDTANKAVMQRLRHMEKELGMEMPDDDDPDNMPAKDNEDTEKMGVSNPERMSRGQMRQAARDKDRTARSGRYGDPRHIEPNPRPQRGIKHG